MKRARGFSLVELMVVISIIGLLAAALGVAVVGFGHRSKVVATQALVKLLDTGCETYNTKFGRYPGAPMASADTAILHQKLCVPLVATGGGTGSGKTVVLDPFIEVPMWRLSGAPEIRDDWGRAVRYTLPGTNHAPTGLNCSGRFDVDASGPEAGELGNWNLVP